MFDYVKADGSCSEAAWLHVGAYFHKRRNRGRGRLAAALRILVPPASFRGGGAPACCQAALRPRAGGLNGSVMLTVG